MFGWLLLIVFIALSITMSLWFIIGVFILSLWKLNRWFYYSSKSWRKVHFPMMRAYAAACGRESAAAESEGREFNINTALITLLGMVNPKISTDHELLIEREFERCNNFYDKPLITSHLINQMKVDESKVSDILKLARKSLNPDDKGLMVRMVIASIIEEQFSKEDRGEYMLQVFLGKAS